MVMNGKYKSKLVGIKVQYMHIFIYNRTNPKHEHYKNLAISTVRGRNI